jgi:hypothetical protein
MRSLFINSGQNVLADIHVDPNNDGLPGVNAALRIVGCARSARGRRLPAV